MGEFLEAGCEECKFYKEKIEFGGSRSNFQSWKPVPGIDKETGELVVNNYYDKDKLKDKVIFYNEPGMYEGEDDGRGHRNGDVVIKHEKNKCPNCGKFTMRFISTIMFD